MPSRRIFTAGLLAAFAGGAPAGAQPPRAPEFAGIEGWLGTAAPVTLASLRGKVILVDFWTYSCINCRRTVPYLNRWQSEYGPYGLQVVGIHTPEFGFEHRRLNVEQSVRAFGIRYPVGQDNGFRTWRAWNNRAWPAFHLLDREGRIVLLREGEGHARELEAAIRALLGLPRGAAHPGDDPDLSRIATPEIYFGALQPTPQEPGQSPRNGIASYRFGAGPRPNGYELDGTWNRDGEVLALHSAQGAARIRFSAAKLHLVASAPQACPLRITVDGIPAAPVTLGSPTLYTLLDGEAYGEHLVELASETPGLSLFSATFG